VSDAQDRAAEAADAPPRPDDRAVGARRPPAPGRRGYQRSATGLIGALLACLGLIAVVFALSLFQHRTPKDPAGTISFTAELGQARAQAGFAVLAPHPVTPDLRATSVEWQPIDRIHAHAHWHLGFVTSAGEYIGLEQSSAPAGRFVATHTAANLPGRPVVIAGRQWQTLTSKHEVEHAYIWSSHGVTTLVTGTAAPTQMVGFIRHLR
jgi:hypothetical protein